MARTVRSSNLETRSARLRLKPRAKPYRGASAKKGLHLGYRRIAGRNGSWVAFTYQGQGGRYSERVFGAADDYTDADDVEVLEYYAAQRRVSDEAPPVRYTASYTVADAVRDYVRWLAQNGKSAPDGAARLSVYATEYFGDRQIASLKPADFERWLEWALAHKPQGRRKDGKQAQKRPALPAPERSRRRKSSVRRIWNYLHAALERAADQGHVAQREAWSRLKMPRGVESARVARLSAEEARRLVNACDGDFRQLVEAALLTGCRYGELTALRARDHESRKVAKRPDAKAAPEYVGTILVAQSKSGKPRRVPLTTEGQDFFEAISAGKAPDDLLLTKADGKPWAKSEQFRRIAVACTRAKISPPVNFHALRHSFASLLVEAGTPLAFVAEALGHADIRMASKYYAHLAPSVVHDSIRANLPHFGVRIDDKVKKLRP